MIHKRQRHPELWQRNKRKAFTKRWKNTQLERDRLYPRKRLICNMTVNVACNALRIYLMMKERIRLSLFRN